MSRRTADYVRLWYAGVSLLCGLGGGLLLAILLLSILAEVAL